MFEGFYSALRDFKIGYPQIADNLKFAPVIMLWTCRGASRHCKMLGTDKAWEVFDQDKKLIEGYVAIVKEMAIKYGVAA